MSSWLERLAEATGGSEAIAQGTTVSLDVSLQSGISLPPAPEGYELTLTGAGEQGPEFPIDIGDDPPSKLSIRAAPKLERLRFNRKPFPCAVLELSEATGTVVVSGLRVVRLELNNGRMQVEASDDDSVPESIFVSGATFFLPQWTFPLLELEGEVGIIGPQFFAERTVVRGPVTIGGGAEARLGEVEAAEPGPAELTLVGRIQVNKLPDDSKVHVRDGYLNFISGNSTPCARATHIEGHGLVDVDGVLERPNFVPSGGPLGLQLGYQGQVLEASGAVALRATRAGLCQGSPVHPLRFTQVESATEVEIENVSLYDLSISDLRPLKESRRLWPWIPRGWRARKKARELEDRMQLGGGGVNVVLRKRAYFWTELSAMLREKHAPGAVQSEVRYAAARARRKAAPRGREKTLLTFYALAGYGERIARPIALHGLVGALGVLAFPLCRLRMYAITWIRLFVSPLGFFRLATGPSAHGIVEQVTLVVVEGVGLLLLLLAVLAARRIAKAE